MPAPTLYRIVLWFMPYPGCNITEEVVQEHAQRLAQDVEYGVAYADPVTRWATRSPAGTPTQEGESDA